MYEAWRLLPGPSVRSLCVLVPMHVFVFGGGEKTSHRHHLHSAHPDCGLGLDSAALVGACPLTRAHTTSDCPTHPLPKQALPASLASNAVSASICGQDPGTYQFETKTICEICSNHTPVRRQAACSQSPLCSGTLVPLWFCAHWIFDHIPSSHVYFWVIDAMVLQLFWAWTALKM